MLLADDLQMSRNELEGENVVVETYLNRIGYKGPLNPTAETLRQLHCAHMLSVPFENLDIPLGRPIALSIPAFYDKIVLHRRGGFCYELNGLFGWLLEQLGFDVQLLSAKVFDGAEPGIEFDHLTLLVGTEERLIADVGFGDSFLEPLWLDSENVTEQQGSSYRLRKVGVERILERRIETEWEPQYSFLLTPHQLTEFSARCQYHQTSPESHFTQKAVCTLATADGRITVSNNRLIITSGGRREEREISGEKEYRVLLKSRFGIDLGDAENVDRLLVPGAPPDPAV